MAPIIADSGARASAGGVLAGVDIVVVEVILDTTHIRPAEPTDAEAVRVFLDGLSPSAQHGRFFTALGCVSPSLVRALVTSTDRRQHFVAVLGFQVIGHAMAGLTSSGALEIAFVVADHHQRQGIGTRLVRTLVSHAMSSGADRVVFEVLCENQPVLDWLPRVLPGTRFERSGYTMIGSAPIGPADGVAAA